jgi:hypothetical protein
MRLTSRRDDRGVRAVGSRTEEHRLVEHHVAERRERWERRRDGIVADRNGADGRLAATDADVPGVEQEVATEPARLPRRMPDLADAQRLSHIAAVAPTMAPALMRGAGGRARGDAGSF